MISNFNDIPDFDDFEDYGTNHIRESHYQDTEILEYSGTLDCDDYEVIEPTYELAYASPSFVKKAFYGLRGKGDFPDFNDQDKKTDLYHPNNQAIYDPYDFPDTPICPDAFLASRP